MNFFKQLFTRVKFNAVVTVHLKSGKSLLVECDDVSIEQSNGDLISYEFKGSRIGSAMFIRVNDISAITYKRN